MTRLGFVINASACSDQRTCMAACKQQTNAPLGSHYLETFTSMDDNLDKPGGYFLPMMCQHCEHPSCAAACSHDVFEKREDGLVVVGDTQVCKTCENHPCTKACPYGRVFYDSFTKTVGKCDGCASLVDAGGQPACIPNCWHNAIVFGDLDDEESWPSVMLKMVGDNVHQLKPETGNNPNVYYILEDKEWRDMDSLYSPAWRNER